VLFLNPGTVSNTPPLVSRYQTITNPQFTIVLGFTMAWIYPINANSAPNLEEAQCGLVISDGTKYVTHAYKGEAHRVIGGFNGIDAQGWPWTNDTTQSGSINLTVSQYHATGGPLLWLKLVRDATHLTFYMGPNGQDWTQVNQVANTFLTPTRYGFFTRCGRDTSMAAVIYHFAPGPPTGGCRYYCN
jgi:hypothetical protein